jgi:hypothetical protein
VVCNPRKNAPLKHGNKSDKIDARKLADRLPLNDLEPALRGRALHTMTGTPGKELSILSNSFPSDHSIMPQITTSTDVSSLGPGLHFGVYAGPIGINGSTS